MSFKIYPIAAHYCSFYGLHSLSLILQSDLSLAEYMSCM